MQIGVYRKPIEIDVGRSLTLGARSFAPGLGVHGCGADFLVRDVDKAGKGLLAFNVTGNDFFPSVGFVEFDGHHIKPPIRIAAAGVGPEDGFSGYASLGGNGTARWGDYSAATLSADGEFWFASGYIPNKPRAVEANWGTFIAHLSLKCEQ